MKKWYKSKTLWFNAVAGVALIVEQNLPVIQPFLPPHIGAALVVAVPIVNLALRLVTTKELHK